MNRSNQAYSEAENAFLSSLGNFWEQSKSSVSWYDFGARNYDPSLGMWFNVDPMAEKYISSSPYHFTANNPVNFRETNGMEYEWKEPEDNDDRIDEGGGGAFAASNSVLYALLGGYGNMFGSDFFQNSMGEGSYRASIDEREKEYVYNPATGEYLSRNGVVDFEEVYANKIAPNSVHVDIPDGFNLVGYSSLKGYHNFLVEGATKGFSIVVDNDLNVIFKYGDAGVSAAELKLVGTYSYIYDGINSDYSVNIKAGNYVRVKVTNFDLPGVFTLADHTTTYYKKTWTGLPRKEYGGESYTFSIQPLQTMSFEFCKFVEEPYEWTFNISPSALVQGAFLKLEFYSTGP